MEKSRIIKVSRNLDVNYDNPQGGFGDIYINIDKIVGIVPNETGFLIVVDSEHAHFRSGIEITKDEFEQNIQRFLNTPDEPRNTGSAYRRAN